MRFFFCSVYIYKSVNVVYRVFCEICNKIIYHNILTQCICDKFEMQQIISSRGVITWSILHGGCNCMPYYIVVQYGFFKMAAENFAWNRVFIFSQLFFFLEKKIWIFEMFWNFCDNFELLKKKILLFWNFMIILKFYEIFEILWNFWNFENF